MKRIHFLFLGLCLLLSACNTMRYLDESKRERLLVKNTLTLKSPKRFKGKTELVYALGPLYKQVPNERWLFMFRTRLWLYQRYKERNSRYARWILKKVAEPPTIYDDEQTQRTARNFENYMRQRGYFDATCTYQTNFTQHKAKVQYTLHLGDLYRIDTVLFTSRDPNVQYLLRYTAPGSFLKSGGALDGQNFDAEKMRITNELKNRGYANFIPNFIEFTGDSTGKKANVTVEVLPMNDTTNHRTYKIGKVAVFFSLVPDYNAIAQDATIDNIYYASAERTFSVRPERLNEAIAIRPGHDFKQEDFDKTYRNLNALGLFKFIAIKPVQDSLNPENLDVTISFSANKRLSVGWNADLNYSNGFVSSNLLGVAANVFGQNRNLLRGGEHITTNLGGSLEFDLTNSSRFFNSTELKFQNNLTIPRFHDYLRLWKTANRVRLGPNRLLNNSAYARMKDDAQARISLSFNYLDLLQYYSYNLFHASFGYDVPATKNENWTFDHIGIDVLKPDTTREKWRDISQNEFVRLSFGNQLFTGFLLRAFNYNFSGANNRFGERWNFRLGSEISGLEEWALFKIWSLSVAGEQEPWRVGNLDFSKFVRLDLDGTYTRDFNPKLTGIFRLGAGAVWSFGDTKNTPYVKQFFIGGPNSLRAWRIRELGPGAYFDAEKQPDKPPFYQTGDFRLEFNGELRFPLFWWLKGAVFLDGGNIWTFKNEADRPGAQLNWNSYKNIALGTGFGFRADFEYFVLRFDWGLKLRRPYSTAENPGYWLVRKWKKYGVPPLNLNIAVGYPF